MQTFEKLEWQDTANITFPAALLPVPDVYTAIGAFAPDSKHLDHMGPLNIWITWEKGRVSVLALFQLGRCVSGLCLLLLHDSNRQKT